MLWHNQPGFKVTPGKYMKIKLPWLSEGGDEWHAISMYLRVSERLLIVYLSNTAVLVVSFINVSHFRKKVHYFQHLISFLHVKFLLSLIQKATKEGLTTATIKEKVKSGRIFVRDYSLGGRAVKK